MSSSGSPPRVAVVGAGLSGLAAAFRLRQLRPDFHISIFEAGERPGGKIRTEHAEGFSFEHGPNGFLTSRTPILELCRELGLTVMEADPCAAERYLWLHGRRVALPRKPLGIFLWRGLSLSARLRLLADLWQSRRLELEDESVHDFISRQFGPELAEHVADPFCTGVFGADSRRLSCRSAFGPVFHAQRSCGSVIRGMLAARRAARKRGEKLPQPGRLATIPGGMSSLVKALLAQLSAASLHLQTPVEALSADGRLSYRAGDTLLQEDFDAVILACDAQACSRLLAPWAEPAAAALAAIPSSPMAVAVCGYHRDPGLPRAYGLLAPSGARRRVLGVLLDSRVFPSNHPRWSLRVMLGGPQRPDLVQAPEEELRAIVQGELQELLGISRPPDFFRVIRWPAAIPLYETMEHARRVAAIEQALAPTRIRIASNCLHGVSMSDCAAQGLKVAQALAASLPAPRT